MTPGQILLASEPQGECLVMKQAILRTGYAHALVNGRRVLLHRWSYETFVGPIPEGMLVCHRCDVRNCINPDHLFLGDHAANVHDMIAKGRWRSGQTVSRKTGPRDGRAFPGGEGHPNAKLTNDHVREIRSRYERKRRYPHRNSTRALAEEFGITPAHVGRIIRKEARARD